MNLDLLDQLEATITQNRVSIVEFAESLKFCGKPLYPRQKLLLKLIFLEELTDEENAILDWWEKGGRSTKYGPEIIVSPGIRERVDWLKRHGYKHFREVVLVGGRRCSKGFMTGMAMAKKMYDCLQLQDPGTYYGIDKDKEIYFSVIAASQQQAKQMQYADFSGTVNACVAMSPYVAKTQELEFSVRTEADIRQLNRWKAQGRRVQRDTAKLRGAALPANARSIRGSATMAVVFDEFAHFMQGESDQSDNEVYEAVIPALAQFRQDSMIFCNSSPYSKVGKFYERFEEGMSMTNGSPTSPFMLTLQFPSWALYEGWWEDSNWIGPKKCITVSPDWDPERKYENIDEYYYVEDDRIAIISERILEEQNSDKYKVERRGHFAEVADAYLDPLMVDRMYKGRPIGDTAFGSIATNRNVASYNHRYKMHLDPSSTTAGFGFAIAHTEMIEIDGVATEHVIFDLIKRWLPKRDFASGVIDWEEVLQEIIALVKIFRPFEVTFDQFQSNAPIQFLRKELRALDIGETRVYEKTATATHNWNRAEVFKTALYQGLVHAPNDEEDVLFSVQELKYLQEIRTSQIPRIEKQDVGPVQTKDMADCIMECVDTLIGNIIARQERENLGAQALAPGALGGYPIGGPDRGGRGEHNPLSHFYTRRKGEQAIGVGVTREKPQKRERGGKPIPRKLPGW